MPYNKQLTNRPCPGRTGEYWPWVVPVRTSLRSVRTATTSGQYSPVRPSRSVSKRLLICFSTQIGMILKKHLNSRSLKQVGARSFGKIKTRLNTVMVPYRHTVEPRLSGPRLSGLYNFPDFFSCPVFFMNINKLWSQKLSEVKMFKIKSVFKTAHLPLRFQKI